MGFVEGRVNPSRTMVQVNQPVEPRPRLDLRQRGRPHHGHPGATHWDALAHCSYGGVIYNGYPASAVTADGAARCGIHRLGTVVSRGVLLDVARALGRDVLEPGYPITPDDLDAACELARVAVEPGDIVLVRTGQMVHLAARISATWSPTPGPSPGLTIETADVVPRARRGGGGHRHAASSRSSPASTRTLYLPVHLLHLVEMGMTQGQNWVLDPLADDCAADGRYTFLLDATPLPLTNGARLAAQPGRAQVAPRRRRARRGAAQHRSGARPGRLARRDLGRRAPVGR